MTLRLAHALLLFSGIARVSGAMPQKPDAAKQAEIIEKFRGETMTVAGSRSSVSVGSAVAYNGYTGFFNSHKWSAREAEPGNWIVVVSGKAPKGAPDSAAWSYTPATAELKPLDAYAEKLAYRKVSELSCVADPLQVARKAPAEQLVILPLPAPPQVRPYFMRAEFLVNASGVSTILEWNEPKDPEYARKVFETLRGYLFRPALNFDGNPVCSRVFVLASIGIDPRR